MDIMADYGVAITFGDTKPGREKQSLDVWADSLALNDKAVADGRIERWDAILFEPSGTPPAGAIRLYGTQEQIDTFVRSDEFQDTIVRAGLVVNAIGYRRFMTGDALVAGFARFTEAVESL
jgi:hypothetical protein